MRSIRDGFLDQALEGIRSQTMKDWELIILNARPRRKIEAIDDRIRIMDTPLMFPNYMIRIGIESARSDYVAIANDDDICQEHHAEWTCGQLDEGNDIVYCGYKRIDELGTIFEDVPPELDYDRFKVYGTDINIGTGGFNRNVAPPWNDCFYIFSDVAFIIDCHNKGLKIKGCADERTLLFRQWSASLSMGIESLFKKNVKIAETNNLRRIFNDPTIRSKKVGNELKEKKVVISYET